MLFRPRRMTENEFLLIEWWNVVKGVEIENMIEKFSKEEFGSQWYDTWRIYYKGWWCGRVS